MTYEEAAREMEQSSSEAAELAAAVLRFCEEHREQIEMYVGDLPK